MKVIYKYIGLRFIILMVNIVIFSNPLVYAFAHQNQEFKTSKELIGNWLGNLVCTGSGKNYEVELNITKKSKIQLDADLSVTDLISASKHYLEVTIDNDNYILKDIAFEIVCGKPEPGPILLQLLPDINLKLMGNNQKLIGNVLIGNDNYSLVLVKKSDKIAKLDKTIKTKSTKVNNKDVSKTAILEPKPNPNRLTRPNYNKPQPVVVRHTNEFSKKAGNFVLGLLTGDTSNQAAAVVLQESMNRYNNYIKLEELRQKNLIESSRLAAKNYATNYSSQLNNGISDQPINTSYQSFSTLNQDVAANQQHNNNEAPLPSDNPSVGSNSNLSYKNENGILKAGIEHNTTLPEIPDNLKAGVVFDENKFKDVKLTRFWYRIPNWSAGSWYTKSQKVIESSNSLQTNQSIRAEEEGNAGFEMDKKHNIWNFMFLPCYGEINANNSEPIVVKTIVFYFKPLKLEPKTFVTTSKVYEVYVFKASQIILKTLQYEAIDETSYINNTSYKTISSIKWFDDKGNALNTDIREAFSYRKAPFTPYDKMPALKKDFINYLINHGLKNLVP